ncbi:MAG: glycoside hydrolase family 88 protein [Terracidiphilus sp.]|jgi:rhamnogalacturonyl hydrolase YesR
MRLNNSAVALCVALAGLVFVPVCTAGLRAQMPPPAAQADSSGDDAANPGPLARDLSPALTPRAIRKAMRKMADWQLRTGESRFSTDWTYAALYDGLLAASRATGDKRYHDAVLRFAERTGWKLGPRFAHADDEAVAQSYLELYLEHPAPERIAAIRAEADNLLPRPDDPDKDLWWWCDALFMAPPALARLAKATGDRRYLEYMDREWWLTSGHLYDPTEHLYARDASFLRQHEKNGARLFWSRGNGWVLAGLARVLDSMPPDYPSRGRYVAQFRQMAQEVAAIQGPDGLWRSGLLDPAAYAHPEVSGSAFFTFALAWGVNAGLLDRKTYEPVVAKAWEGMLTHIYADGRLGSIQKIGGAPGEVSPGGSYVYGVGAFLLAGSELDKLARSRPEGR